PPPTRRAHLQRSAAGGRPGRWAEPRPHEAESEGLVCARRDGGPPAAGTAAAIRARAGGRAGRGGDGVIPRKVAVIGAGDIGVGWAALCASAGWPVAIFDLNPETMERASIEIERRTRALVALGRAPEAIVERGLSDLDRASSLSEAIQDADWVIEAIHEDVAAKQKLLAAIEQVAGVDALISSSSSGLAPTEIFGRMRRLDRCLVTHPLNPPELIPIVEVVPEGRTSVAAITRAVGYLRALGRHPILLKKSIPGYVVGRIAAAVWRECIDLVLRGVISVDDLDRAVSLGPGIGWAAAGPHLTYHLAAGEGGI